MQGVTGVTAVPRSSGTVHRRLVERSTAGHHASEPARMVRSALVGGRRPVEMTVGLILILISIVMIAFIVRTVQANMPR